MKKILSLSLTILVLGMTVSGFRAGLIPKGMNMTGSANGPVGCEGAACHSGSTDASLHVALQFYDTRTGKLADGVYEPEAVYRVVIQGSSGSSKYPSFGFQVSNHGLNGGVFFHSDNQLNQSSIGSHYLIESMNTLPQKSTGYYERSFFWKAPIAGQGTLSFYGVLLAANGDGTGHGDIANQVVTSLNEKETNHMDEFRISSISLYPNPAMDHLFLMLKNCPSGSYQVRVLDLSGRQIYSRSFELDPSQERYSLDIENIQSGIYMLYLEHGHFQQIIRFVKQ